MSRMKRLSLQQLRLKRKMPPSRPDHRIVTNDPAAINANARKVMALHDQLPDNLRLKAKERQDFKTEEEYQRAKRAGYATDVEDA
jgi:hypothetical protein